MVNFKGNKKIKSSIKLYRVTRTKDEISETTVRNLFSPFSCVQGSLSAKTGLFLWFSKLSKYLIAETNCQALNRHIFRVLGRLYSLMLCW